jgi:hypothetical protein
MPTVSFRFLAGIKAVTEFVAADNSDLARKGVGEYCIIERSGERVVLYRDGIENQLANLPTVV